MYIIVNKFYRFNKITRSLFLLWIAINYLLLTGYGANLLVSMIALPAESSQCTSEFGILLPSGMSRSTADNADYGAMTLETLNRVHAARRWLEKNQNSRLIISGNTANHEVSILKNYLSQLGVSSIRIVIENQSNTTYNSALNSKHLLNINAPVVLITSQIHMRRAKMTFESEGYTVCPLVSHNQYIKVKGIKALLPDAQAIIKTEKVMHELVGIMWYWKTGRI